MKIVINSHINSTIALNHLLESMKLQKEYNEFEIIITIGGYYNIPTYDIKNIDNITYIYCNHNSIDFTALITLYELYNENINEYYFYLHDTCKVGNTFYEKLKLIETNNISSIRLKKGYTMNIGIYSQKILNDFKDFLLSVKNTDENRCLEFKDKNVHLEGYIFDNDKTCKILEDRGCTTSKPTDYYNTGTMRIVEHYNNLDLYKIKANWGQSNNWILQN
jgi:hypothetical protein